MRYPEFLKENGTIGVIAPSFGCATEPYISCMAAATDWIKSQGYTIVEGPNCHKADGLGISSSPENCGRELTDFYLSSENDMLLTCGGGELMCETVDFIDFEGIKKAAPKWYMGYSDNTNFTFLSNILCDTAAIYGPSIGAFGAHEKHQCLQDTWELLKGNKLTQSGYPLYEKESLKSEDNPYAGINATEQKILKIFEGTKELIPSITSSYSAPVAPDQPLVTTYSAPVAPDQTLVTTYSAPVPPEQTLVTIEGRLTGGCLDCLANLVGTRYDKVKEFNKKYASDKIIWFLEACDLSTMAIRRAIWNLDRAGWFENASGFIIGRPLAAFGTDFCGVDQYNAVHGILGKYNVPIIMDADIGHISPTIPLISGAYTKVTANTANLTVEHLLK